MNFWFEDKKHFLVRLWGKLDILAGKSPTLADSGYFYYRICVLLVPPRIQCVFLGFMNMAGFLFKSAKNFPRAGCDCAHTKKC